MSDNEYISDEEDWLEFDDFPYNEAEDLATHTVPSPPFIDYDPDYDTSPNLSDWEYGHDDYWDEDTLSKRKHNSAREDTNKIIDRPKKKRRRLDCKEDIPAPTVIWKSKRDLLSPPEAPIVRAGQGEKVALLKDWRERFKSQPNRAASRPESKSRGSQIATAVLIGDGSPEPYHSTTPPPTTLEKAAGLPSRNRVFASSPEHKYPVANGTTLHTPDSQPMSGCSTSARLVRNTTMAGKKRNIAELPNHQEDELPAPKKKRPGTPKKKMPHNPQSPKQPLANKTNTSIPASRKRKADDSAERTVMSPRKRNADDSDDQSLLSKRKRTEATKTEGVEARASEENGSSTRRTTRRTR